MKLVEYLDPAARSRFAIWFGRLDAQAAAKVAVALSRIEAGNLSNVKSVGGGVVEFRIHWGPGYRIYFAQDGDALVILLAGGIKHRQQRDVEQAQQCWAEHKQRKKEGS